MQLKSLHKGILKPPGNPDNFSIHTTLKSNTQLPTWSNFSTPIASVSVYGEWFLACCFNTSSTNVTFDCLICLNNFDDVSRMFHHPCCRKLCPEKKLPAHSNLFIGFDGTFDQNITKSTGVRFYLNLDATDYRLHTEYVNSYNSTFLLPRCPLRKDKLLNSQYNVYNAIVPFQ